MTRPQFLLLFLCIVFAFVAPARAADALPVQFPDAIWKAPASKPADGFTVDGLRAVYYDGLPYKGKPTRIFAWIGLPKNASTDHKVPAMVLVHGGGGTAFSDWVKLWNDRGYAAIAMDTCGQVPKGTYGKWERNPDGGPPGWGGFGQVDEPVEDQWPFHAITSAVLGHSLLRSLPEVDADRVGVTGISWGGYLTCILSGVDQRFKLAVPVYGCGFLGDNSTWVGQFEKMGKEKAGLWLGRWDPSNYLKHSKVPMLWVTGTNDFAYPMDSLQKSYKLPTAERALCLRVRMPHGHNGPGEKPEEIRVFVDSILNKGTPLAKIVEQGRGSQGRVGDKVWVNFKSDRPIKSVELTYTADEGPWQKRKWETVQGHVKDGETAWETLLPSTVKVYYINLIDDRGCAVSTQHEVITAPAPIEVPK